MELGYKFTLEDFHSHNKTVFDPGQHQHSLSGLHNELRVQFKNTTQTLNLPDNVVDSFEDYYRKTAVLMKFFDRLDSQSFAFRYPVNKKGDKASFPLNEQINLLEVKEQFDVAMIFLGHTADVLSEYADYHGEHGWYGA